MSDRPAQKLWIAAITLAIMAFILLTVLSV